MVVAKLKSRRDNYALNDQVVLDKLSSAPRGQNLLLRKGKSSVGCNLMRRSAECK
jgi:hypothetical protein